MKRIVFLACSLSFLSFIPLQSGLAQKLVKDFSATDINGNKHRLSDYLSEGKVVILDFSTTWCGPCWNYHQEHHLEDLYQQYGPDGTDEFMVFFVESDPSTGLPQLHGKGSRTRGDWVSGTSYPIIDDHTLQQHFDFLSYPTIITICPDRKYSKSGTWTVEEHYRFAQTNCTKPSVDKDLLFLRLLSDSVVNCQADYAPVIEVINWNADSSAITNFDVEILTNGSLAGNFNWSGHLPVFHSETVKLPLLSDLSSEQDIAYRLLYQEDLDTTNNTLEQNTTVELTIESSNLLKLNIQADDEPAQVHWKFENHLTGEIVASGSPPVPNELNSQTVDFRDHLMDCIVFTISDSGNDGNSGNTFYEVIDLKSGKTLVNESNPYGSIDYKNFQIAELVSSQDDNYKNSLSLYPNPAGDFLRISSNGEVWAQSFDIEIVDLSGQVVLQKNIIGKRHLRTELDISHLDNGIYCLNFRSHDIIFTHKLLVIKP